MVVMTEVIEIMYVFFHSIIFHGNASNMFNILETSNKLDPCCHSDLSVWCTGGSLCLWCCTSSDLSDCACWCLSCVAQQLPFSSADGGKCSAARQPLGRERRGHLCTSDRSLCERVRDDEMTRWVDGVESELSWKMMRQFDFPFEVSMLCLAGMNSLSSWDQTLCACLGSPRLREWIDLLSQLGVVVGWQRFNNFRTGMLYFTDSGWRPCLVSMLEKLLNFPFFPCHVLQLFAHLYYPEHHVERRTQSNLIWSRCHGLNINNLNTTTLNIPTSKHTTYQQMNH